jgi:hypothetical protein
MPTDQILSLLVAERDRLNRAIEALQGGVKRAGRPAGTSNGATPEVRATRKRKPMTPAQKKAHSERMKAFWAARRKAK